jgi:hypothetical protein
VIANCNRDSKKKKSPYKIDDFMPTKKPKTKQEVIKKVKQFMQSVK